MGRAQHSDVSQLCDLGSKALRDPENILGRGIYTLGKGLRSQTNKSRAAKQCGERSWDDCRMR